MFKTDLQLASSLSKDIGLSYKEAVEFSRGLPSYALIRYRDALEGMCDLLAARAGLVAGSHSLFDKINALGDAAAITFGVKDRCHRLRLLCNPGAHSRSTAPGAEKKDDLRQAQEKLATNALEARDVALWLMEYICRLDSGRHVEFDYARVEIQSQEWKELLFDATVGSDAQAKFKAGLWCEAEAAKKELAFSGIIASAAFENEQNFFLRLAATFYLGSYNMTRNIDAGFRYAQFVVREKIDADKLDEARKLIETAANAGHGEACDYHASILYDDVKDYASAEKFWLLAAQRNVSHAFSCLYFFYTEGKACAPDPDKARAFVEQGVQQDCRDSLYTLGRACFEGQFVPKDDDRARELLMRASELGHGIARGYLLLAVNGGAEIIADEFAKFGQLLAAMEPSRLPTARAATPDPYALCSCGSGKKYRWCCKSTSSGVQSARSELARFLPPLLK